MLSGFFREEEFLMPHPEIVPILEEEEDSPSELLEAVPELRARLASEPPDDLGLRALLERPGAFAHSWWREQARRSRPLASVEKRAAAQRASTRSPRAA
jgi:hypothetical protein